jgi:ABC-2 type transport system ATP-binding protein
VTNAAFPTAAITKTPAFATCTAAVSQRRLIERPMPETIVHIDSLTHRYGQRTALSALSLDVFRGEIFGFLGPNGSGKTTLFRILSTLLPVEPGHVSLLGMALPEHRDEIREHLGVVFQSPSLDKQLTAEENLRCHGNLYGLRGAELNRRIDQLLERVNLGDRRHERVEGFSGGMRRRVELAKGLLNKPDILLLDEPSTGLDPGARIDLWRYLREIQQRDGVTILLTTHLMDEGDRCTRLAILDRGKLAACDTPANMKDRIGGDIITLAGASPQAIHDAMKEKLGVSSEIVDQSVRLERPRGHEFVPQVIEALPGLIQSVSVGKPSLEDVFIQVTGRIFKDDPAEPFATAKRGKASRG